jgi:hypothetical protein
VTAVNAKYVICIKGDDEYPASLKVRKIYRVLPDELAENRGWIRVIDESEEDYLYPASRFVAVELTEEMEQALFANQEVQQDALVTGQP